MRTKSKGAQLTPTNGSDEDEKQKSWFERWGYIVLLIVLAALILGALGFWLIRRAYLKAILVPVSDVTPSMLPVQVPNSTFSYFSLPDGVKNWNPESASVASGGAGVSGVNTGIGGTTSTLISDRGNPVGVVAANMQRSSPPLTAATLNAGVANILTNDAMRRGLQPQPMSVAPPVAAPVYNRAAALAGVQQPQPVPVPVQTPQQPMRPQFQAPLRQPAPPIAAAAQQPRISGGGGGGGGGGGRIGVAQPSLRAGFAQNFISNPDFM